MQRREFRLNLPKVCRERMHAVKLGVRALGPFLLAIRADMHILPRLIRFEVVVIVPEGLASPALETPY
jgi:hypothetical protein